MKRQAGNLAGLAMPAPSRVAAHRASRHGPRRRQSPTSRFRSDVPRELIVEPDVVVLTCEDGAIELECAGGATPQTPQYAEYEVDLVKRGAALAWRSARQERRRAQLSFTLRDPGRSMPVITISSCGAFAGSPGSGGAVLAARQRAVRGSDSQGMGLKWGNALFPQGIFFRGSLRPHF